MLQQKFYFTFNLIVLNIKLLKVLKIGNGYLIKLKQAYQLCAKVD